MIALLTLTAALASEQHLVYDLSVNGAVVGSRQVTVRYLDRPGGERRVVETMTEVHFAGQDLTCRAVGNSGSKSTTFSAQTQLNGQLQQNQGVQMPGQGWDLTLATSGKLQNITYKDADAVFTTLDLVDPGRTWVLGNGGRATLLFVETGDALSGTLSGGTTESVTIGGTSTQATMWTLTTDGGVAKFDVDGNGLLLRSDVKWLGVNVVAQLHTLPEQRAFGTIDTIDGIGTGVTDTPL